MVKIKRLEIWDGSSGTTETMELSKYKKLDFVLRVVVMSNEETASSGFLIKVILVE